MSISPRPSSPAAARVARPAPAAAGRLPAQRCALILACLALSAALTACGGGQSDALDAPQAAPTDSAPPGRHFALWADGEEAMLRAEQAQADPLAAAEGVQLLVRLNPAAVFSSGRATMLAAPGAGEGAAATAQHAAQLDAKAQAVAGTAQAVMARSVLQVAPGAVVRQQFAHAVEAFTLTVPWHQARAVAAELARNPAVDAVEPDRSYSIGQTTRALDARAWGVDRIDQRSRALDGSFRQALTGSGVNLYVLDTGISAHSQFGTRLAPGFSAISDGRGSSDCHGHGTHVAGTAGGSTLGVAPEARLVPVRVMDCAGSGLSSWVLAGLDWVAAKGTRPGVVNLSLGGGASATIDGAVQRLITAGFSVVAAAGNSNADACGSSPARAAGVIAIAASDTGDAKANFSNWGTCVALWAPGTGIVSASRAGGTATAVMNGTSMAAPHAAGAAALLLQASPSMVPAQVRQQLLAQATASVVTGAPSNTTRSLLYAGAGGTAVPVVPTVAVGSMKLRTELPGIGSWRATAQLALVRDTGQAVAGARLTGRFSNATQELSCTSNASGLCEITSATVSWAGVPALGFAVTGVTASGLAYVGGGPRSVQVARPAPPQARIQALTGTMLRSSPTAVEWVPQFQATVRDETGAAVIGATVLAVLNVHSGASVVGQQALICQTGSTGQCTLAWSGPRLNASRTGAVLQVQTVARDFLGYRPGAITSASVGTVR